MSSSSSETSANYSNKMKTLQLGSGYQIPVIGFGLAIKEYENPNDSLNLNTAIKIEECVEKALEVGYRHFDTAYLYKTETQLGTVLSKWISSGKINREDLFVTTKLPCIGMHSGLVPHFIKLSLEQLQLDYIDLYLIHWPIGLMYVNDNELVPKDTKGDIIYDFQTDLKLIWKELEKAVQQGIVRSIGLSNFSPNQIERICSIAEILPSVLQIEMNVYIQQKELHEICSRYNIQLTAFAPLGSPGRIIRFQNNNVYTANITPLNDPSILEIAKRHGKTPAQILLRFLTQQNISVIPKSINTQRMIENLNSLDFNISAEEMKILETMDKGAAGRIFDFFPGGKIHPEYPF